MIMKWTNLKTDGFLGGWGERSRREDAKFRTMHIRWWGYLIHLSVQIVNTDSLESQQSLIRNSGNSTIFKFLCVCAVFGCVCLTEWVCICMFARLTSIVLHSDSRLPILVLSSWAYKIIKRRQNHSIPIMKTSAEKTEEGRNLWLWRCCMTWKSNCLG